jgi:peptidoglycan DL-endopeptidase CwlO
LNKRVKIVNSITLTKTMPKQNLQRVLSSKFRLFAVIIVIASMVGMDFAQADQYDAQINALQQQNNSSQSQVDALANQASSYQAEIDQLAGQIAGLQAALSVNQAKQASLQQQIATEDAQLVQNRQYLGDTIRSMYEDGQMTTIEELATSKDLSDYVDKQAYGQSVQDKVNALIKQIAAIETQQKQQKAQLDIVVKTESQQENQLASEQSQQQSMLAYNQSQQDAYNSQIQANQSQIAVLRQEQIAANRRLVGSGGGVVTSGSCGGSYPASASGPYGNWGCNYSLDNTIDNWGMYNRECVSYTAWMVYHTYGYMPYWGGSGDARQWPGDAQAAGIPTGTTPKVGSVAIYMGGAGDPWGHAMWVDSVNGDGTITVSQYNLYYDGNYYVTNVSAAGLVYIYFGG